MGGRPDRTWSTPTSSPWPEPSRVGARSESGVGASRSGLCRQRGFVPGPVDKHDWNSPTIEDRCGDGGTKAGGAVHPDRRAVRPGHDLLEALVELADGAVAGAGQMAGPPFLGGSDVEQHHVVNA